MNQIKNLLAKIVLPPIKPPIKEWAEKNVRFDTGIDTVPAYIFERSPWHGPVFEWFADSETEEIFILSSAQSGKSTALIVCLMWQLAHDPAPVQITFPDEVLTKGFTFQRFLPVLKKSFNTEAKEFGKELGGSILGSHVHLAWASSETRCRSWPRKIMINDETSLFRLPLNFISERTKTFHNKKIISSTTPTIPQEQSWKLATEEYQLFRMEYPCFHCGLFQLLEFENLSFEHCRNEDNSWDFGKVEADTRYRCIGCTQLIHQKDRFSLIGKGVAVNTTPERSPRRKSIRVTCLDNPTIPWGISARKFLESKNNPESLQVFNQQWLAKPWENTSEGLREKKLRNKVVSTMPFELCPKDTEYLIAGVDVQKNSIYAVVRAFQNNGNSQLVYCTNIEGTITENLAKLHTDILLRAWFIEGTQEQVKISACAIDTGYQTDLIYDFCRKYRGLVYPVKGAAGRNAKEIQYSKIEKFASGAPIPGALTLYTINASIFALRVVNGYQLSSTENGSWTLPNNVPKQYYDQIECYQVINKGGAITLKENSNNHYFDCEKYALAIYTILKPQLKINRIQKTLAKKIPVGSGFSGMEHKPINRNY